MPFVAAVASSVPVGLNASEVSGPPPSSGSAVTDFPVLASQIRAVESRPTVAT
jgi:hypothetical protein